MTLDAELHGEVTWFGGVSLLLTSIVFVAWGGFSGLLASGVLAILSYRLRSMYAAAFGHFALLAVTSGDLGMVPLALAEVGLFGILIGPVVRFDHPLMLLPRLIAAVGVLGAAAYAGLTWYDSVSSAVALCFGAFAVAAYGLDWYDRITLDVVAEKS